MSSMTSWCILIQGAYVHVADCGGCALCRGLTPDSNKKRSIVVHLHTQIISSTLLKTVHHTIHGVGYTEVQFFFFSNYNFF